MQQDGYVGLLSLEMTLVRHQGSFQGHDYEVISWKANSYNNDSLDRSGLSKR